MILRIIGIIWIASSAFLGIWVAALSLDNEPPYEWDASQSVITPDPARQGGRLSVNWHMKVNRLCPGSSQRSLIDAMTGETVATYDATAAALSVKIGDKNLPRTFMLPPVRLPPLVGYRSTVCFRCNALQAIFPLCVTTPTLTFRVDR